MDRRSAWIVLFTACLLGCATHAAESSLPPSRDPRAPTWTSLQDMHAAYLEAFVESDGFGIRRITPMMALVQGGTLVIDQQRLRVEDVQMIGIARHDPPVVYAGGVFKFQHAGDKRVADERYFRQASDPRPVDDHERRILARLQAGQDIVSQQHQGGMTTVAPIRATASCLQCHQGKHEGELLGAFVYRLQPLAK